MSKASMKGIIPIFKTQYNAYLFKQQVENVEGQSNTIPDQTLSIPQIIDRYQRGLRLDIPLQNAEYSNTYQEIPDFPKMDLIDKQHMLEAYRERIGELEENLRTQVKEKKEAHAKKRQEEQEARIRESILKEQKAQHGFRNADQAPQSPPSIS